MSDASVTITNSDLNGIFQPEEQRDNNTAMLRLIAGLYLHTGICSDYQGRYTSNSYAFDAGSVDGVRLYFHPDYAQPSRPDWGSGELDNFRSRLGSRSTKPKILILLNQMPRMREYPTNHRRDMPIGNYTVNRSVITFINDEGLHLGALALTTGGRQTYRLYVYNNFLDAVNTGNTLLNSKNCSHFDELLHRATKVIKDRENNNITANFTFVDLIKYATENEAEFVGYKSEFDITSISKRQVTRRIDDLSQEHRMQIQRATATARNLTLAKLEQERLEAGESHIVDLSKVDHPFIDLVYVEETSNTNSYPIIRVLTKVMSFFPDGGTGDFHGYDEDMGIPVGRFTITINFNSEMVVTFKNESYSAGVGGYSSNMHHPHIFSGGDACWGNFGETLSDLIMKFDIVGLIDLSMLFIQQANYSDSAGHLWRRWTETNTFPELVEEYKTQQAQQEAA